MRSLPVDPDTDETPLHARTKANVNRRAEYLISEKIDPWLMMGSTKQTITLHNGRTFGYYGWEYDGTVITIFWESLIDPFLEDDIQAVLDEVGAECRTNGIDASVPLDEAASLLRGMVYRVYDRMVDVDQKLCTKGRSEKAPRRDVQWKIDRVKKTINEQLKAAKALYSGRGKSAQ